MKSLKFNKAKLRTLEPTKDPFTSLARSIINQQISTKAAASIYKKFTQLFRKKKPTAKFLITLTPEQLRSAGLSRSKVIYIQDLAAKFLDKTIDPKRFDKMSDEEIREHLIQVKGIGVWSADMFLIFALNRPDVLPTGDLVIRKGFQKAFNLRSIPSIKRMHQLAKVHAGERTYLSLYLWSLFD